MPPQRFEGHAMKCSFVLQRIIVGVSLVAMFGGCNDGGGRNVPATGGATPEAAFKNVQAAAAKGDCEAYMSNMTDESQELFVGRMAAGAAMMQMFAGFSPEAAKNTKAIKDVLDSHGLTEERLNALRPDPNSRDPVGDLRKLARTIDERGQFMTDLAAAFKGNEGGNFRMGPDESAVLKDVKISDDDATGTVVFELDGEKEATLVEFKKVNGKWLVEMTGSMLRELEDAMGGGKEAR